ncbi:MAG: amidase, partial [Cytophagaceae bacterium]|nr:amidase [Gemmatimonadaceae bacterium]
MNTRRQFLIKAPLGLASVTVACSGGGAGEAGTQPATPPTTPGAPVAFGTSTGSGPEVSAATFAEAEKLAQVANTDAERATMASSWRRTLSATTERRTGPRKVALPDDLAPATLWDPARAVG